METLRKPNTQDQKEHEMTERIRDLKSDNKRVLDKLSSKKKLINELYDELKKKDEKLKNFLKEKNEKQEVLLEENDRLKLEFNRIVYDLNSRSKNLNYLKRKTQGSRLNKGHSTNCKQRKTIETKRKTT